MTLAPAQPVSIVEAPCSLGLQRPEGRPEPGTWQAPAVLRDAGLYERLAPRDVHVLEHPAYDQASAPGSRQLNGPQIRAYCEQIAARVAGALEAGDFPLVIGGDCSILLGCLYGARQHGPVGLVHLDGHSDYSHPGNQDEARWLRAPAGMALALATGKGEPLLSDWGAGFTPLVREEDAAQLGERENLDADYAFPDIEQTAIHRTDIRTLLDLGVEDGVRRSLAAIETGPVWVHLDIDILDQSVMPAVDCPGSPGLDFEQLTTLVRTLMASRRIVGLNLTIFDPDLDPDRVHAARICDFLHQALTGE